MNIKRIRALLMVCSLVVMLRLPALTQQSSDAPKPGSQQTSSQRDGQHDFDFEIGTWKIHLKRLEKRLAGSTTWIEFD